MGPKVAITLVFIGLVGVLVGRNATAATVTLTLESYAPAGFPKVSTTIDLADPSDQLEVSGQALLFALSPCPPRGLQKRG